MALTATLHTVRIALNDADRSVYETFELRVARHPSETLPYMLTRILAYCLFWEADLAFSKGLSTTDEPALWSHEPDGRVRLWIDVGHPSAARLHKASKLAERVAVCTHQDPDTLRRALAGERIHRADQLELLGIPASLLQALETTVERRMNWDVAISGNHLYVTSHEQTHDAALNRQWLQS
jgi:uncharacterized protein YaeQ